MRVVLYFRMMQQGFDDVNSGFTTSDYFKPGMEERFRYCGQCIENKRQHGRSTFGLHRSPQCNSPAEWGVDGCFAGGPELGTDTFGRWNNRCPASFYWLAEQYEKHRGPLNHTVIEKAFSSHVKSDSQFAEELGMAGYTSDYKWVNSIYCPPRYWEAASVGTINWLPKRVADQEHFPLLTEGEHYITFPNDMSRFELDLTDHQWSAISLSNKALYEHWIRGREHRISTNLLKHIKEQIESIQ